MNGIKHHNHPQIVKLSSKALPSQVNLAISHLAKGDIIATPTDTIYGLAASVQVPEAVTRLYKVKGRRFNKPIAICVQNIADVYEWCKVTIPEKLLSQLLPGPVTCVFDRLPSLNPDLNPDTRLIGIRIPDHDFVRQLCKNGPLALTSANVSCEQSSLDVQEFKQLFPALGVVFDGGQVGWTNEARLGSTVVDLSVKGHYRIIREGSALENTVQTLEAFQLVQQT